MDAAAAAPPPTIRGTNPLLALIALIAGIALGMGVRGEEGAFSAAALNTAGVVGGLWLDALKMTVIPLVVTLLITGVAKNAEVSRGGRIAGRTVVWIVVICTLSAIVGTLLMQLLLNLAPLSGASADALRSGVAALGGSTEAPQLATAGDFLRGLVPDNVIAAASNGDVLPLVVFSLLFALALSFIAPARRTLLVGFFAALADALLVIIGWVLWVAPAGIFALALTLGASAGGEAFGALVHYILLVSVVGIVITLLGYPLAVWRGRVPLARFSRAMLQPQAVAVSTRSSLASLPAMLAASRQMGIREESADISLPIAVALFRATGPAMNVAVALYVAHWMGLEPTFAQLVAATAVAAVMSYAAISLPGEITFISSIAPIAMALGAPVAPLALLVAVEMIPDIVRTLGNVTLDVALTATVDAETAEEADQRPAIARTRSE